ncbi:MAG TPA: tryptophan--tRNA ligase [Burkholderiaceae bacterium]|nr:tryptophan--tRNA ligase [Burkholderiaceae bacterium]HQR69231.1 tryptophan--tRNA ligase [Burkholderiaceae bacterium]
MFPDRVLSGMRPTGALHIGHYHGALKNWVRLQDEHPCFFFVADWHALTTHYETPEVLEASVWDMLIDWFAAGLDPKKATVFIQSRVPEHAELFLLLSMATPLGWLERVPTYKDQIEKIKDRDLSTYGFLGYPLMQAADILIYRATMVPVGEDQVPHIEMTREIARRFNNLFGREPGFEEKAKAAVKKLGNRNAKLYEELRTRFQEQGDTAALEQARALLAQAQSLSMQDRERAFGYLEGARRVILVEPHARLTETPKLPGLDGQKMAKSLGNSILMREEPKALTEKIRRMTTDPARVRRTDPGEPERCPVWQLHRIYSSAETQAWAAQGCRTAGIGCLDCKQPVIDAMLKEQQPWRERAQPFLDDPLSLRAIVADGCDRARAAAQETMRDVRDAMGLVYR